MKLCPSVVGGCSEGSRRLRERYQGGRLEVHLGELNRDAWWMGNDQDEGPGGRYIGGCARFCDLT